MDQPQRSRFRSFARLVFAVMAVSLLPGGSGAEAQTAAGFVTRAGVQLFLDGQPFTFSGLNIYNANSDGTCGSVIDLDQALTDIGPGKTVMRAWFFQDLATAGGVRDWTRMDQTLAIAAAHGVKVIPVLANQWADCDQGYGYKTKAWYQTGYQGVDPSGIVSYRDWVAEVVSRYRDNPTVAFWQLINEGEIQDVEGGNCSTVLNAADTLRTWAADVAGLIKSMDRTIWCRSAPSAGANVVLRGLNMSTYIPSRQSTSASTTITTTRPARFPVTSSTGSG